MLDSLLKRVIELKLLNDFQLNYQHRHHVQNLTINSNFIRTLLPQVLERIELRRRELTQSLDYSTIPNNTKIDKEICQQYRKNTLFEATNSPKLPVTKIYDRVKLISQSYQGPIL